jgi:hypothetical protein
MYFIYSTMYCKDHSLAIIFVSQNTNPTQYTCERKYNLYFF